VLICGPPLAGPTQLSRLGGNLSRPETPPSPHFVCLMEKDSSECPYPLQYFDEFIGHELEIECALWKYEFAAKICDPNLGGKTTKYYKSFLQ